MSEREEAERLRRQGNDAFATRDWERALDLYQQSLKAAETSKAYSNLAATLCKLSQFPEAEKAAERATVLEPTWAKAWWRRGVVAEMLKKFVQAYSFYRISVELEPDEKTFGKAAQSIEKRLDMTRTSEGLPCIGNMGGVAIPQEEVAQAPSVVAWNRFVVDNPDHSLDVYVPRQDNFPSGSSPTSEQWLVQGMSYWASGLRNGAANLAISVNREANQQYQTLLRRGLPEPLLTQAKRQLLGGDPAKIAIQDLASGLGHLGGLHIGLKVGGTEQNDEFSFCSQPRVLSFLPTYQHMSILYSIWADVQTLLGIFGKDARMSKGVLNAYTTFYTNMLRRPRPEGDVKEATPEEVVEYLATKLREGHSWDAGVRRYVSLQYRGTILYAALIRLFGQVADSFVLEKWAHEFIMLADEEFKVSEEKTYDEKGSSFRPSFRIGMMMSAWQSLAVLSGDRVDGPYPMSESLSLCASIAKMAKNMDVPRNTGQPEYCYVQNDVAYRRKPLAKAHSTIGHQLTILESLLSREDFDSMADEFGFRDGSDDQRDPFALIAENYRIAAEAELPDSADGAIYWWAYAANMARAGDVRGDGDVARGGYTLGDLRSAIAKAEQAEEARDIGLFGVNPQRGGSLEALAKLTADHFQSEPDSFTLPQIKIVTVGSTRSLRIGDDEVICPDFCEYERKERESYKSRNQQLEEMMDTSSIDKDHGPALFDEIPSLETLCIRELHRQGCEFAAGETDAAVIHYKTMMAAQKKACRSS